MPKFLFDKRVMVNHVPARKSDLLRYEKKYPLTEPCSVELEARLRKILPFDKHGDENGNYSVRSVYFEDWYDTAVMEKLNGYNDRSKYRIRLYNGDTSFICLERKRRISGMSRKTSARITEEQCMDLLNGNLEWMFDKERQPGKDTDFFAEAYSLFKSGYHPKTIVEYTRQAFICPAGNVRITIDKEIFYSTDLLSLLDKTISGIPLPLDCWAIFEVKYNKFLPLYIQDAIQTGCLSQQSYSKYVSGRVYG